MANKNIQFVLKKIIYISNNNQQIDCTMIICSEIEHSLCTALRKQGGQVTMTMKK